MNRMQEPNIANLAELDNPAQFQKARVEPSHEPDLDEPATEGDLGLDDGQRLLRG